VEDKIILCLAQHKDLVLLVVMLFLGLLFYKNMTLNWLEEQISLLMLSSEKIGRKDIALKGEALMEMVVMATINLLVPRLPFWLRPLVTEEYVRRLAQLLHDKAKDYIDDGKINHST